MAVDGSVQVEVVVHRQSQRQRAEAVLAEPRSVEVSIVHRSDGRGESTAGLVSRRELLGQVPITGNVVPVVAEARDHLERQVLVVLLRTIAAGEQQRQLATVADGHQRLQVQLLLGLLTHTLPLVRLVVGERDVATQAIAEIAGLNTRKHATRILATTRNRHLRAAFHGRVERAELQGATEVVGGGSTQRTRALRQCDIAKVFGGNGAADVHAVVVAVAHVAERQTVERVAELRLVEAADSDTRGPLVSTERIGRLEVHAGELFDGLDGAGARRDLR